MKNNLEFSELLQLIDDRSAAFRAAIDAAHSLDLPVPTCPEWTLFDLAQHLGRGCLRWAATINAGPAATAKPAPESFPAAPREHKAMHAWLAASTQELLDALREAGPDRACYTGWGASQSPHVCGAVAGYELHEIAVHTYDALIALGTPRPLPDEVALDAVQGFLFTACATTGAWPHKATAFDFHATEGRAWRLTVDGDGARTTRIPVPGEDLEGAGVRVRGTASELTLVLHDRILLESLQVDGDAGLFDLLRDWEPEE